MAVSQVIAPPQPPQRSAVDLIIGSIVFFVTSYWWFAVLMLSFIIIAVLVYFIWKKDKEEHETIFERDYKKAIGMARMQANPKRKQNNPLITYSITGIIAGISMLFTIGLLGALGLFASFFIIPQILFVGALAERFFHPFTKSDPVVLRYKEKGYLSERALGSYQGEFYGNDGFFYLLFSRGRFIFKKNFVVKIPQNINLFVHKKEDEKEIDYEKRIKSYEGLFKEVIEFTSHSIIINHAKSIEKEECFYYPVFVNQNGMIIDNGLTYYESDKRNAMLQAFYAQSNEFAQAQKDAIKINPTVRFKQATGEDVIDANLPNKKKPEEFY